MIYTFDIAICGTVEPTGLYVSADTVTWEEFTGKTITISLSGEPDNVCYVVLSSGEYTVTEGIEITNIYTDCGSCIDSIPRSAGTESTVCVICNDIISGETITVVSPPHPVWTDSKGTAVTQLNAIALGGMNGLNS